MNPQDASYIWSDSEGAGRNRYVLFRRGFRLGGAPRSGRIRVFADTRYRLVVNGVALGHGPARFFVHRPEYDTYDLLPFLRPGANVVAVTVNSYGTDSFHSQRSIGGLIAWGHMTGADGKEVSLATGPSWKALASDARQAETHCVSFALNPAEVLDARELPAGWELASFDDAGWPPAVVLAAQDHWGELRPRSIPMLDEREVLPRRRLGVWAGQWIEDEDRYSFVLTPQSATWRLGGAQALAFAYLHSPREQDITFGAWWGRYWINGQKLEGVDRQGVALRQDVAAHLHEGWNTLVVADRVLFDCWTLYFGFPRAAEVVLSAEKDRGSPHAFLLAGPWEGEAAERAAGLALPLASPDDLPDELGPWRPWPRAGAANSAWFERAWKKFVKLSEDGPLQVEGRSFSEAVGDGTLGLLYDFGGEVLGRPTLTFTAAAGTTVDLTYSEKLRDGLPHLYYRPEVRMAERYVARAGRQTWQTFHPRGFRYLEVLVQGKLDAFALHKVSATRANYPVEEVGNFECSDPLLNEVWQLGRATQYACMEDAYLDCPWRERGLYAGDFLVQFYTNLAAFGDTALMRRCIELLFLSQGENGMLAPCSHGLKPGRHPDYSAITVQALWHYYARTGDAAFLREMGPYLTRLMAALEGLEREQDGLVDGTGLAPYVDLCHMDREGVNCALNCFHERAFFDAARIMDVIGEADAAESYRRHARRLAGAIREAFWDGQRGAFVDRLRADVPDTEPSVPANALPLLYDIAGEEQAPGALAYVADAMVDNFRVPEPRKYSEFNVSCYFSFYALAVLYRYGRAAEAERFIRTCWGRMLDEGVWTCWENFTGGDSWCHAWASSPTHYLSTQVLGVTFPEAGDATVVRIAPQPGSLAWAAGAYPHPAGPIKVRWQIKGGELMLECDAPEGVTVLTDVAPRAT